MPSTRSPFDREPPLGDTPPEEPPYTEPSEEEQPEEEEELVEDGRGNSTERRL